ncbi:MAG: cytochrome c [Alphaproteobacteria bacterium]|nr:cytochrome c [Alphaproteobacteria bacterium]MCB9931341.1 cytochrome c [Alphaproteobacteria bacterium]
MKKPVVWALAVVIVAVVGVGGWRYWQSTQPSAAAVPAIDANDAELVALGRDVYRAQCASCHGLDMRGEPNWQQRKPNGRLPAPPHNETGHTWHHPDSVLFALTKYGLSAVAGRPVTTDMPAFEGTLSDREIAASLAYIKSTWPLEIRRRHQQMSEQAARKR